jgi:hypothetical protein
MFYRWGDYILTAMTRAHRSRQAGAEIKITEEMIAAGIRVYKGWEPEHIFDVGDDPPAASPYAIRELVEKVLRAALAVSSNPALEGNPPIAT